MSTTPNRWVFPKVWRGHSVALVLLLLVCIGLVGRDTAAIIPPPPLVAATHQTASLTHATLTNVYPQQSYMTLTAQQATVGTDFSGYYTQHDGLAWLGAAIMGEVSVPAGEEQVFAGGVLLRSSTNDAITALPVVTKLINEGAQIPLGGAGATLTYGALRAQLAPALQIAPPWWWHAGADAASAGIFINEGSLNNKPVGHYIAVSLATYLASMGDWQSTIGIPLTEAQTELVTIDGRIHHFVLQVFTRAILTYDRERPTPDVTFLPVGTDYITIFGPPVAMGVPSRYAWIVSSGATAATAPGTSIGVATLGGAFPVALQGETRWLDGVLWYHILWQNPVSQRDGWVMAAQLNFAPSTNPGPQTADLAALAPDLAAAVSKLGNNVAVAIGVPALNRYYIANGQLAIPMGSTFKLPILLTLINQAEQQHRPLTDYETSLAAPMIENSDNDAATILYDEIGYDNGVDAFLSGAGISGISINTDAFGYSTATPLAMAQLLNALWSGKLVTATDRQYALELMQNVEPDQQMCVGTTAPTGAIVALKDGWLEANNGWVTDAAGIVTTGGLTYTLAIFSQGNASSDAGWANIAPICAAAAAAFSR